MATNMAAISHAIRANRRFEQAGGRHSDEPEQRSPEEQEEWELDEKWKMVLAKVSADKAGGVCN